ncbi:MAG TPA: kelch repeat-containing protein [Myxococcaceae bacterium]|nr:kelch repeat-containing protein [Myxococcaceae bacterium]
MRTSSVTRRLGGSLLVVALSGSCGGADPGRAPGTLTLLGDMLVRRSQHTATLLPDGRVLIAGGGTPEQPGRSAEIYDPSSGASVHAPDLVQPRAGHTATVLADGRVLIVGGLGAVTSAELYEPASGTFRLTSAPLRARSDHAAVLVANGKVLVLGGDVSGVGALPTASAELFDPETERFREIAPMLTPRRPYGVVALPDGRLLIAGGTTTGKEITSAAEVYDPELERFESVSSLTTPREKHASALLPDGRVLILGGNQDPNGDGLNSTEIFDPSVDRFVPGPELRQGRYKFSALGLPDGSSLAVGGARFLAERLDRGLLRSLLVSDEEALRFFPALTPLDGGQVLISGGYAAGGSQASVWRFAP